MIIEVFKYICIILILVVVLATIVNAAEERKKIRKSKISFKESLDLTELPIVTFYNGPTKLNFLLDTGSNLSHINKSMLPLLIYKDTDNQTGVIGMEGNMVVSQICNMTLTYKENKYDYDFCITDLSKAFDTIKQEDGVQIHGILGNGFFEKYKYVIDFKEFIAYTK